jgi:hypothetical protein
MISDQQLSLFEYRLRCVLHRHLDAQFLPWRQPRPVHSSLQKLAHPVATILALLAWEGQPEPDQAARAFDTGMRGYIGGDHTHRLPLCLAHALPAGRAHRVVRAAHLAGAGAGAWIRRRWEAGGARGHRGAIAGAMAVIAQTAAPSTLTQRPRWCP